MSTLGLTIIVSREKTINLRAKFFIDKILKMEVEIIENKNKYEDIRNLNNAWGYYYNNFEEVRFIIIYLPYLSNDKIV